MAYTIEIATSDYSTTKSAVDGGADRIELCANMGEGGTTPSYAHIRHCREDFDVLIYPIIRPRGGDFCYTEEEFEMMKTDIRLCKELGCDGVVTGLLHKNGSVDYDRTAELVELAYPLGVTYHRAFDRCNDSFAALEVVIRTGCERILTSGLKKTAPEAIGVIKELQRLADERIIIMPGSGVRKTNIRQLAEETGCREFHTSLRAVQRSPIEYINPAFADDEETTMRNVIHPVDVRELRAALEK